MKADVSTIEKYFHDFDPYLCYALMHCLKRDYSEGYMGKSDFVRHLIDTYNTQRQFADRVDGALSNVFDSSRICDQSITRRIRDINLYNQLVWNLKKSRLKIENKVTGRALELIVESVLDSKLGSSKLYWEFVDWNGLDYMILDTDRQDWIVGIQCKYILNGGDKSHFSYKKALKELKDSKFPKEKTLIMFCGGVKGSLKEEIKKAFENEEVKLYYLWENIDSNKIDESFYGFIDAIKELKP